MRLFYKIGIFPFLNNAKYLDSSYKTDLDLGIVFKRINLRVKTNEQLNNGNYRQTFLQLPNFVLTLVPHSHTSFFCSCYLANLYIQLPFSEKMFVIIADF